ncbi:hypothetical protein GE09DRAFT_1232259 [Coniochaeta sp. 2T2.1]|nr:hypothetical protein GE09DRAFT_1232259 [Coniochaeta sp. 2T2.1]
MKLSSLWPSPGLNLKGRCLRIDGNVNYAPRLHILKEFETTDVPVLLMTVQTGAVGPSSANCACAAGNGVLDENIDEAVSQLSFALQVLHQKDVGRVQDDIEHTNALLGLVQADQVSSTIHAWLKAPDAATNYNEACRRRHPQTRGCVEHEGIASWEVRKEINGQVARAWSGILV